MDEIKTARTEPLVGGARLELTTKSGILPVVSFTAAVASRFSELARGIEQLAKGEELAIKLEAQKTRCEKCDRLLPEPDGRCPACVKRGAVLKRVLAYIGPYKQRAVFVALLALASQVCALAIPFLSKQIIDRVFDAKLAAPVAQRSSLLLLYVGGIVLSLLASSVIDVLKGWNVAYLGGNIAKDLRASIYRALEFLQLGFYDKKQIGAITSRVTQDTDRVWGFLVEGLPYMATAILTLSGTAIFGFIVAPKLTAAILVPVPIVAIGGVVMWKPMSVLFHKIGQKWGRFHTHLNESLNGIRVVKAFAREEGEWAKFDTRNKELALAGITADRRWYVFNGGMMFFTGLGSIINWLYGGSMVLKGEISFGTLLMTQQLLWQVYGPLQWFSQVNQWFSRAMAGAERRLRGHRRPAGSLRQARRRETWITSRAR